MVVYYSEQNDWQWDSEEPCEAGWYWQREDGDGDPHGPFDSELEAIEDLSLKAAE